MSIEYTWNPTSVKFSSNASLEVIRNGNSVETTHHFDNGKLFVTLPEDGFYTLRVYDNSSVYSKSINTKSINDNTYPSIYDIVNNNYSGAHNENLASKEDLNNYVTWSFLDAAMGVYPTREEISTLTVYRGGEFDFSQFGRIKGKIVKIFVSDSGVISGIPVNKGEYWEFIYNGVDWSGFNIARTYGISSPWPGEETSPDGVGKVITWQAVDGAVKYQGMVNGNIIDDINSPWTPPAITDGSNAVYVRAINQYGGYSQWSQVNIS